MDDFDRFYPSTKAIKLTVENFQKVSIIQSYVGQADIALMIVQDSYNADTFLDEKNALECRIRALAKRENKQRTAKELNGMFLPALRKIAKELKMTKYWINKKDLIKRIQAEEYSCLAKRYRDDYNHVMEWSRHHFWIHRQTKLIGSSMANNRPEVTIDLFKTLLEYLLENEMFWLANDYEDGLFNKAVKEKIAEFQDSEYLRGDNQWLTLVGRLQYLEYEENAETTETTEPTETTEDTQESQDISHSYVSLYNSPDDKPIMVNNLFYQSNSSA